MPRLFLLVSATFITLFGSASAMEKQTRRHPLCGVEKYVTLTNDPRCPVAQYIAKVSSACTPIYNLQRDATVCGYDTVNRVERCERIRGSREPILINPLPEQGCGPGYRVVMVPTVKICRNQAFGVERYESCRDPSHGVESYQACSRSDFPIKSYRECSFYKTPEELDAYIEATLESLQTYALLLPAREGELLTRIHNESALACLVKKYEGDFIYDDVVKDMKDKFFMVFGYDVEESNADCSDESKREAIKFTLGALDCDQISRDAIPNLVKPSDVSENLFFRFKQNCTMKKSFDVLVDWFATKSTEVSELQNDIVAASDPNEAERLRDLQRKLQNKQWIP